MEMSSEYSAAQDFASVLMLKGDIGMKDQFNSKWQVPMGNIDKLHCPSGSLQCHLICIFISFIFYFAAENFWKHSLLLC